MPKRFSFLFIVSLIATAGFILLFNKQTIVEAAVTHVVISQVQVTGSSKADDEFVEFYNPTGGDISLTGWSLKRETTNGATTSGNLASPLSGTIHAHSFFLITSPQSIASSSADMLYSTGNHMANNGTVLLFDNTVSLIDEVGFGNAADKEGNTIGNPSAGGSVERKLDENGGPGVDTDNNSSDFIQLLTSDPRNSSTVVFTPTPTITPTLTPIPTVTPTFTPTPTVTPSPMPSFTPTPTETPIPTNSPTPTDTPTPTPTNSPTPTITPTNSPTPTVTPSPSPSFTPTPTLTPIPSVTLIPTDTPTIVDSPTPTLLTSITPTPSLVITSPTITITPTPSVSSSSPTKQPHGNHDRDDFFPHITWKWEFHRFHVGRWDFSVPFCHFHVDRHRM